MYIGNNNLSGLKATGWTPIINGSQIDTKNNTVGYNKSMGIPTPNPPMTLTPGMTSPNWDYSYLRFYQDMVKDQQRQLAGMRGLSTTDILQVLSNPTLDNIKSKVKTPEDAKAIIDQANLYGIKLDPSLLTVLTAIKDQGAVGDDDSTKAPVIITKTNTNDYLLYGGIALVLMGTSYYLMKQPKSRRR